MWREICGFLKFVTIDLVLYVQLVCLMCLMIQLIQQLAICLGCPGLSQASQAFLSRDRGCRLTDPIRGAMGHPLMEPIFIYSLIDQPDFSLDISRQLKTSE